MATTIRLGDEITAPSIFRGAAKVTLIEPTESRYEKYGYTAVDEITVDDDRCFVLNLDNNHFVYGYQLQYRIRDGVTTWIGQ